MPIPDPSQLFRALADRTRLRIVNLLLRGPLCVCDMQRILAQPQSSVSRHLALLKSAGLVRDRRDGMRTFYTIAQPEPPLARDTLVAIRAHLASEGDYRADIEMVARMRERGESHELAPQQVLFACVHNAGRSQMAAALFNQAADPARARAVSAGTRPGRQLHPVVLKAMKEAGLDLSSARPRLLDDDLARSADIVVTMGCGEECPYVRGVEREDWALPDPKGRPLEEVRAIRDEIALRVSALVASRAWERAAAR